MHMLVMEIVGVCGKYGLLSSSSLNANSRPNSVQWVLVILVHVQPSKLRGSTRV